METECNTSNTYMIKKRYDETRVGVGKYFEELKEGIFCGSNAEMWPHTQTQTHTYTVGDVPH